MLKIGIRIKERFSKIDRNFDGTNCKLKVKVRWGIKIEFNFTAVA